MRAKSMEASGNSFMKDVLQEFYSQNVNTDDMAAFEEL
jgi:hypothetical protein